MRLIEDATFETLTRYEMEASEVAWALDTGRCWLEGLGFR